MARIDLDSNAATIGMSIDRFGFKTGVKVQASIGHHGMLLQAAVKRRAAEPRYAARPGDGNEGPRIITGDYNRSIDLRIRPGEAFVGTNKPQGRRLEFGFVGTDSLGRVYDQIPYPHFGPALDEVGPLFVMHLAGIITDGWSD